MGQSLLSTASSTMSSGRVSGRGGHFALARSKSVCDIAALGAASDGGVVTSDESSSHASSSNKGKKGRVVRNRTILGSFPLFYKLSQSLSSLNTDAAASVAATAEPCISFQEEKKQGSLER